MNATVTSSLMKSTKRYNQSLISLSLLINQSHYLVLHDITVQKILSVHLNIVNNQCQN